MTAYPRAPRGARTLVAAQVVKALVMLLGIVVLSRLLDATDFGAVAVAIAIIGVGELLRDLGLSTAATTAPELTKELRDLLFWLNIAIALLLAIGTVLLSPVLGEIFDNAVLANTLPWLSGVFVLNGIGAQYRASLNRDMRFNAMAVVDSIGAFAGVLGAILIGLSGGGYWALIAQPILVAGSSTIVLLAFGRWVPGRPRKASGARAAIGFGVSVSWSQVLMYAGNNVDTLALGYLATTTQLGYYTRAFQVAVQPLTLLKAPATSVALPLLSIRRENPVSYERAVAVGLKMIAFTIVPIALFLCACAAPIVSIFLGQGWDPVIPIISLLAAAAAVQQYAAVASWMFLSANQGRSLRRYSVFSLITKVVCVLIAASGGPEAVALAFLVSSLVSAPVAIIWACRSSGVSASTLARSSALGVLLALLATGVAALVCASTTVAPVLQLTVSLIAFLAVYGIGAIVPACRREIQTVLRILLRRGV